MVFNNKAKADCNARAVFDEVISRVAYDVGRMNQGEPGLYRLEDVSFERNTHKISILKEKWGGTVVARVIFDLGGRSITVKQEKGGRTPRIAFQVIPGWDSKSHTCRLAVYDHLGSHGEVEDANVETISKLALKWLRHEADDPPITATNSAPS